MADMFEYLSWRGDLLFTDIPLNSVDALIFSTLVYGDYSGIVPEDGQHPVPLQVAAEAFLSLPDPERRVRVKSDLRLLRAAADSPRFRDVQLSFYRSILIPKEETQFAAMAFHLPDGTVFLAFRGTDYSLTGWKEDFNMAFSDSVPAQRAAAAYAEEFAARHPVLLRFGGHSKGGNLAVYAASKAPEQIRRRILTVYNLDGPGFTEGFLSHDGYLSMVPKIRTIIPESSIIGILLEHRGDFTVIASRQVGALQHEPYSWEIMAGDFIRVKQMSGHSQFVDRTIKNWIRDMSKEERSAYVEALFGLLSAGGANTVQDLLHPKNIRSFFSTLKADESTRKLLTAEFTELMKAAASALPRYSKEKQ